MRRIVYYSIAPQRQVSQDSSKSVTPVARLELLWLLQVGRGHGIFVHLSFPFIWFFLEMLVLKLFRVREAFKKSEFCVEFQSAF